MQIQSGIIPFNDVLKSHESKDVQEFFRSKFSTSFETDEVNIIPFVESIEGVTMPAIQVVKIDAEGFTFLLNEMLHGIEKAMPGIGCQFAQVKIGYIASPMHLYPEVSF